MRPSAITALLLSVSCAACPAAAQINVLGRFGDGPVNTGAPCVPVQKFTRSDTLIYRTGLQEQTLSRSDDIWLSFNCFYYAMTWILGMLPTNVYSSPQKIADLQARPNVASFYWMTHQIPANAYIDESWLGDHFYRLQFKTRSLSTDDPFPPEGNLVSKEYQVGDIVMVESSEGFPQFMQQKYVHAAIVTQTDGGRVVNARQKVNPWTCVQDFSPELFDKVFGGETYEIWRRDPDMKTTERPMCKAFREGSEQLQKQFGETLPIPPGC